MYDFYFGTEEDVRKDEKGFLLGIKRMLPRWCNSIPDSEYLAIYDLLHEMEIEGKNPVIVETGTGASTIVLLHFALKSEGMLFSWDINGSKGAFLRSVITDTLLKYYRKNIHDHWKFIAYDSNSEYVGISVLKEMVDGVNFCFFDSKHTQKVLLDELSKTNELLVDKAIVAIDDANYNYKYVNIAYVNMLRKKLGLPPVDNPKDNICKPLGIEVENFLKLKWKNVTHLKDTYKENYKSDIFWSYYNTDREVMGKLDMEKLQKLKHRFDAWMVSGRKE